MLDNHGGGTRCINTGRRNTKGSSHLDLDVRFAAAQELDDKPNARSQEGQQLTKYLGAGGRLPGPTMRETRVAIHLSGLGQPQSPSITYPSHRPPAKSQAAANGRRSPEEIIGTPDDLSHKLLSDAGPLGMFSRQLTSPILSIACLPCQQA
jgi:hypothetical protein